jgi:hypothetical protein
MVTDVMDGVTAGMPTGDESVMDVMDGVTDCDG